MWCDPEYLLKFWKTHDPKDVLRPEEYELLKLIRKKFGKTVKGEQFYKGETETGYEFDLSEKYGKDVWNTQTFEQAKQIIETSNDYLEFCERAMDFRAEFRKTHVKTNSLTCRCEFSLFGNPE